VGISFAHSFYLGDTMADVVDHIRHLLDPILASLGLTLWDLEFQRQGPQWLLRIYIDRESGVTLNDCESVSRDLSAALDVEDIIAHAYSLEVSSPGLDRTLSKPEHFARFIGSTIKIKVFQPIDGQKVFRGKLLGISDTGMVRVEIAAEKIMEFDISTITKANLEIEL
jgi:ribosome maturation factor RimP